MIKNLFIAIAIIFSTAALNAQVVFNEIETTGMDRIELKNIGPSTIDVSTYWICSFPTYNQISALTVVSGSTNMAPGSFLVLSGHPLGDLDGELGLYITNVFTDPNEIRDYIEWGSSNHTRSPVAQSAGIWVSGDSIPSPPANVSLEYVGFGDAPTDWFIQQNPTFGMQNGILSSVEENEKNNILIYPTLVTDNLVIDLNETTLTFKTVEVISVNGQVVHEMELNESKDLALNLSHLTSGNYFIKLMGENNFIERIIKK